MLASLPFSSLRSWSLSGRWPGGCEQSELLLWLQAQLQLLLLLKGLLQPLEQLLLLSTKGWLPL